MSPVRAPRDLGTQNSTFQMSSSARAGREEHQIELVLRNAVDVRALLHFKNRGLATAKMQFKESYSRPPEGVNLIQEFRIRDRKAKGTGRKGPGQAPGGMSRSSFWPTRSVSPRSSAPGRNSIKEKIIFLFSEQNGIFAHHKIKARRAPGGWRAGAPWQFDSTGVEVSRC